jgi:hypothetical protein
VTLDDLHWDELGLSADDVRQRRYFVTAYEATMASPPPQVDWLLARRRDGRADDSGLIPYADPTGGGFYGGDPTPDDPDSPDGPSGPTGWLPVGASADALRGAASDALMLGEVDDAIGDLIRAATMYVELGLPYGLFLAQAVYPTDHVAALASRLLRSFLATRPEDEEDTRFVAALGVPAQQLYLLLALAAHRVQGQRKMAQAMRHLHGPAPVGSSAQPFADWWHAASMLARIQERPLPLAATRDAGRPCRARSRLRRLRLRPCPATARRAAVHAGGARGRSAVRDLVRGRARARERQRRPSRPAAVDEPDASGRPHPRGADS